MTIDIHIPLPDETDPDRLIIVSEYFRGMQYEIKGKDVLIYTLKHGVLKLPLNGLKGWAEELSELQEVWESVRV